MKLKVFIYLIQDSVQPPKCVTCHKIDAPDLETCKGEGYKKSSKNAKNKNIISDKIIIKVKGKNG